MVATIGRTKEKNGKSWHILSIIYTIYYICRINILKLKKTVGGCGRLKRDKIRKIEAVEKFA